MLVIPAVDEVYLYDRVSVSNASDQDALLSSIGPVMLQSVGECKRGKGDDVLSQKFRIRRWSWSGLSLSRRARCVSKLGPQKPSKPGWVFTRGPA